MLISELIELLNSSLAEHGDCAVCFDEQGSYGAAEVTAVDFMKINNSETIVILKS